jgi:hypothetical protein
MFDKVGIAVGTGINDGSRGLALALGVDRLRRFDSPPK